MLFIVENCVRATGIEYVRVWPNLRKKYHSVLVQIIEHLLVRRGNYMYVACKETGAASLHSSTS
jgi:hypothetical protein